MPSSRHRYNRMGLAIMLVAIFVASMAILSMNAPAAESRSRSDIQIRDPFILPVAEIGRAHV